MKDNPTVISLLIAGIVALAGVIVWLALYIRKINNDRIKDMQEAREHVIRLTGDNALVMTRMDATVQANTKAIEEVGSKTSSAMDRLNLTVGDLHKWIIGNMK